MKKYIPVVNMRLFKNDAGKKLGGNSKWKPFKNGKPESILLDKDTEYNVSLFQNDDGSYGVQISKVDNPYKDVEFEPISDAISQPGMKSLAESIEIKHKPIEESKDDKDEDEIPF